MCREVKATRRGTGGCCCSCLGGSGGHGQFKCLSFQGTDSACALLMEFQNVYIYKEVERVLRRCLRGKAAPPGTCSLRACTWRCSLGLQTLRLLKQANILAFVFHVEEHFGEKFWGCLIQVLQKNSHV